jgi:uncharacterized protein (DUF983 family)
MMKMHASKHASGTAKDLPFNGACPNCGGGTIVEGRVLGQLDLGGGLAFRPKGRGFMGWLFRRDLTVNKPTFACSECGLMWTFVSTRPLRRMLKHV